VTPARFLFALLFAALASFIAAAPALPLERGMFGARSGEVVGTWPLLVVMLRDPDATSGTSLPNTGTIMRTRS
jgi:hypothetical protein